MEAPTSPRLSALKQFVVTVDAYTRATGLSDSTLSKKLFGAGTKITRIREGSDLHTTRYESAMAWLSTNWPEGAAWPEGVDRPELAEPVA